MTGSRKLNFSCDFEVLRHSIPWNGEQRMGRDVQVCLGNKEKIMSKDENMCRGKLS